MFRFLKTLPAASLRVIGLPACVLLVSAVGCSEKPSVHRYKIPGKIPDALVSQDRMLGAILPQPTAVWFVKVLGPAEAVAIAEPQVRAFVKSLKFTSDGPDLTTIPEGWNRGGQKPMRFATLLIDTPEAQLDVAISQLPLGSDWKEQVAMNVNRWRGQLKLAESSEPWAGGEVVEVAAKSDREAIWVDLVGINDGSAPLPMTPPGSPPFAQMPPAPAETSSAATEQPRPSSGIKFSKPESWRPGKISMMRLEAFNIGPETAPAELTIIQAGGDLRGNVARWLGQIRPNPPEDVVDQALEAAETLQVSGREAKRYYLEPEDPSRPDSQAIDATIVPREDGMSVFIKATGPVSTIHDEKERIGAFLSSLELP